MAGSGQLEPARRGGVFGSASGGHGASVTAEVPRWLPARKSQVTGRRPLKASAMGALLPSVLAAALLQLAAGAAPTAAAHAPRQRLSLDRGWRFRAFLTHGPMYFNAQDFPPSEWAAVAAPGYDDSSSAGWRALDVPHDFVVEGGFNATVVPAHACGHCTASLTPGVGWYRKVWTVPPAAPAARAADSSLRQLSATLTFDGVFRNSTVWLNGVELGQHHSGYTSFNYAVGYLLKAGEPNTLVVRADATLKEGWWYEGGGIYRHTWLTLYSQAAYIAPWGVRVISSVESGAGAISAAEEVADAVLVSVQVAVGNDGAAATAGVTVRAEIFDHSNASLATARSAVPFTIPPGAAPGNGSAAAWATVNLTVANMGLWSIDQPRLYRVVTTLMRIQPPAAGESVRRPSDEEKEEEEAAEEAAEVLDEVSTRFAPRVIEVSPTGGLRLNGKHVKLRGMANHMDFAGLGNALPDRVQYYKVQEMKKMGVNAWRCAHNPPAPEFLDACDELGLLVLDEERHFGIQPDGYILPLTCNDSKWSAEDHAFMDGLPCIEDGVAAWDPQNIADLRALVLRDRNHPSVFAWSLCK